MEGELRVNKGEHTHTAEGGTALYQGFYRPVNVSYSMLQSLKLHSKKHRQRELLGGVYGCVRYLCQGLELVSRTEPNNSRVPIYLTTSVLVKIRRINSQALAKVLEEERVKL